MQRVRTSTLTLLLLGANACGSGEPADIPVEGTVDAPDDDPVEESKPDPDAPPPDVVAPPPMPDAGTPLDVGSTTYIFATAGTLSGLAAAVAKAPAKGRAVVIVPPGTFAYGNGASFGTTRSELSVLGSGAARTKLVRTTELTSPVLAFGSSKTVRVAELSVDGNPSGSTASAAQGIRFSNVTDFRVDHSTFSRHGGSGVRIQGASKGVVDHSAFASIYKPAIGNLGYGVLVVGTRKIENVPFGSERATFVEDSTFRRCRHAIASNDGARYVLRYDHITENVVGHAVDAHGQEYGSLVGTEWVDVHHNVIGSPASYSLAAVRLRGGKGLVWSNTFSGYSTGVDLLENTPQQTGPVHIFGNKISTDLYDVAGGATAVLAKPSGYVPYPYPHPLVTRVVAIGGIDQRVSAKPGEPTALVKLDASKSTASPGTVTHVRWFAKTGFLGAGATISAPMPVGQHVVVVEVEGSNGSVSHDTVVVEVLASK